MSYAAVKWAKAQELSDAQGKGVLIALAQYADGDGMCFPSVRVLAEDTGKSGRTVRKHLNLLRESGLVASRSVLRANLSQCSNEYCLLMGQSILLPWLQPAQAAGVGEDSSGVGEAASPLESLGNLYGVKASLSSEENSEKLKLLTGVFGRYACILTEVRERREKWLELPLETIADAIDRMTGHEHFITDLKLELDDLANVKAPQKAGRTRRSDASGFAGARAASATPAPDPRQETPAPVPGEKSAAEVLAEQERVRLEDEAAPFELSEAGKRFLQRVMGENDGEGGHAPKGRSPPALAQLRFNFARLGPRRDCYG